MARHSYKGALRAFAATVIGYAASVPGAAFGVNYYGLTETGTAAEYNTDLLFRDFVGSLINGAMGVLGVIFLILMVYGGMLWLTAEGETDKIKKARGFIFHSILGLILTLFAYSITRFIIDLLVKTGTLQ